MFRPIVTLLLLTLCSSWNGSVVVWSTEAFVVPKVPNGCHSARISTKDCKRRVVSTTVSSFQQHKHQQEPQHPKICLSMSRDEFSREVRLREEAESPFRKVRFFFYVTLAGGAFTSLAVSLARIAAGVSGINTDLLEESLINAGVDLVGIIVVGFLYQRDLQAEQSRLTRATKGAEFAKLTIRASKAILGDDDDNGTFTAPLSSLRRGRGIDKRVVIAAAGKEKIKQVVQMAYELDTVLTENDLIVIPVVLPQAMALQLEEEKEERPLPKSIAYPVAVGNNSHWKAIMEDEAQEAIKQGVDVENDGFVVVLKKNGRVGQRTKGIFLNNLVGNVEARRNAGMDVTNI